MAIIHVTGDSTQQGGSFALMPQGTYDLRIDSRETKEPSDPAKHPYTQLSCTVMASDVGGVGSTTSLFLSHSPKAAGILRSFLEGAGIEFSIQEGPAGPGVVFDDDHLVNKYIRATNTHRAYNGQMKDNWGKWAVSQFAATAPAMVAPAPVAGTVIVAQAQLAAQAQPGVLAQPVIPTPVGVPLAQPGMVAPAAQVLPGRVVPR